MDYFVICSIAFGASLLTFFTGFGLGTLLLPAFAAFFAAEIAVALTAVVHFLNSLFKLLLVGRWANWSIAARFGIPGQLHGFRSGEPGRTKSHGDVHGQFAQRARRLIR